MVVLTMQHSELSVISPADLDLLIIQTSAFLQLQSLEFLRVLNYW